MIRILAALAAIFVLASPAFAQGPSRAAEINIDLIAIATRADAESRYPEMSPREIDLLLHRICEQRATAMLDL